mmetsp:Transcript_87609/g.281107  ORF Transcript_87609/g.281107 Transcript_87609/m.281107 type:complete len:221 (+) Transcript_87609:1306-1968(+)
MSSNLCAQATALSSSPARAQAVAAMLCNLASGLGPTQSGLRLLLLPPLVLEAAPMEGGNATSAIHLSASENWPAFAADSTNLPCVLEFKRIPFSTMPSNQSRAPAESPALACALSTVFQRRVCDVSPNASAASGNSARAPRTSPRAARTFILTVKSRAASPMCSAEPAELDKAVLAHLDGRCLVRCMKSAKRAPTSRRNIVGCVRCDDGPKGREATSAAT